MIRKLNSDQLGQKGQTRFGELCVDAGLIPNPSTYDRKGWDYVVNWPQADIGSYDARPTPRSCLVQVKTVWAETTEVKLTLAALEQIAKETQPSFIAVQQVDNDLEYVGLHVAHIAGDLLARVLKALRKARVEGGVPNDVELSFALAKWFKPLEFAGAPLRQALERAIGASMGDYVARKQGELQSLGFGQGRYTLRTTVSAPNVEVITDAFLGLGSLEATEMRSAESRFGIEIPLDDLPSEVGSLQFEPHAQDTCTLTIRTLDGSERVRFAGKMFSVPPNLLPRGEHKLRIANEHFDLIMRLKPGASGRNDIKINFKFHGERIAKAKVSAEELSAIYWLLERLPQNRLHLVIQPKKLAKPLSGEIDWDSGDHDSSGAQKARELCDVAKLIFAAAGWPGTKVTIDDLLNAAHDLQVLNVLMTKPHTLNPLSFTLAPEPQVGLDPMEALYLNWFRVGPHTLIYAASTTMKASEEGGLIRWTGEQLTFRDVARARPRVTEMRKFRERLQRLTGINHFVEHSFDKDSAVPQGEAGA